MGDDTALALVAIAGTAVLGSACGAALAWVQFRAGRPWAVLAVLGATIVVAVSYALAVSAIVGP